MATGPEEIQASKWELEEDTEKFIQAAEVSIDMSSFRTFTEHRAQHIVFPYPWTTYNVLVLPASFPYGGMENPVFTFATPTIISGVSVEAHSDL